MTVGLFKKKQEGDSKGYLEKAEQFNQKGWDAYKKAKEKYKKTPDPEPQSKLEPQQAEIPNPKRDELKRLISDHTALDNLSVDQLEHLRLTTESTLEGCEREFTEEEKEMLKELNTPEMHTVLSTPLIGGIIKGMIPEAKAREKQEQIDDLKLLLKLIANKQKAKLLPETTQPQPTREEQREKLLTEIQAMRGKKVSVIENMRSIGASDEDIKRYENMFDNAVRKQEKRLEELLVE